MTSSIDLLVVGAGPAGMSAALAAAGGGLSVLLVDERPTLGGQIYKQPGPGFSTGGRAWGAGRALIEQLISAPVQVLLRTALVAAEGWGLGQGGRVFLVTDNEPARMIHARRLVIASGAYDRPVVFPGWTLPGVFSAGGLQTLVKTQRVMPSAATVFAGSGPVALAFPAQLVGYGVEVTQVLDAGPRPRPGDAVRVARALRGNGRTLLDAARYRSQLARHRVPLRRGRIVVRAEGRDRLERVVHARVDRDWRVVPGTEQSTAAEVLCLGYGFTPSTELARLVGCLLEYDEDLGGSVVARDDLGRTTVADVYAAGDGAGVEGSLVASDEGTLAGLAVRLDSGQEVTAAGIDAARTRLTRRRALRAATARLFGVGSGIFALADAETVVCRCESVTRAELDDAIGASYDINVVKGFTRAGMGPCQGRQCHRHIAALIAARCGAALSSIAPATARMPLRPVPVASIADVTIDSPALFLAPASTS